MNKLWDKGTEVNKKIEEFTIGADKELDINLARFDVIGTLAHIQMLTKTGLLKENELTILSGELIQILHCIDEGKFKMEEGVEDIHSQIEILLTRKLGETGKKIHSARSRNDQVLVDLKLYFREELKEIVQLTKLLFDKLILLSNQHKDILLPGYTHLQIAMPSSFGLWFGAYAESLTDDMVMMKAAFDITNRNPLGSAAGYGSSFPIDRQITTDLLGFASMNFNSVYAQITRGKTEKVIGNALASVASTISKMAMDICLFNSQNFGFISLPVEYTTGSSIMPHKKNPDVMELLRAKCNKIQAVSYEISLITGNLPSGYHRDMQILKEILFPAFKTLKQCLEILTSMMDKINVNASILDDTKYNLIFTVEEVNKLVLNGMAFRDAYKEVSAIVEKGNYKTDKKVNHTHQGSIGNLCNDKISELMDKIVDSFPFQTIEMAIHQLMITSVYKEEENR